MGYFLHSIAGNIAAAVSGILLILSGTHVASSSHTNAPATLRGAQAAAAAAVQGDVLITIPPTTSAEPAASSSANSLQANGAHAQSSRAAVVNNYTYITRPVMERVIPLPSVNNSSSTDGIQRQIDALQKQITLTNRIDTLYAPIIPSGNIAAFALTGTITNAINSASAAIVSLGGRELDYINATTTTLSSQSASLGSLRLASLDCSAYVNGGKLTTTVLGDVSCADDISFFATSSADTWLSQKTTDNLTQGSTNKYYSTLLFAADLAATTTTALPEGGNLYFTSTRATSNFVTNLAATTSVASITALPTLSSVSSSLSGFVKASAGALSTASVNLGSDISGILPAGSGGTGWGNLASGTVLLGNGSGALATTTRGNLTETGSSILTITGGANALLGGGATIQVAQASGASAGFLSSADWNTFANKQAALGFTPVNQTTQIATAYPLLGGGDLSASRTLSLAFGTTTNNTWGGTQTFSNTIAGSINGNAGTATALQNARTINGVSFNGTQNITVTAASSTLLADSNLFSGSAVFNAGVLIGTTSPGRALTVFNTSANPQERVSYDAARYAEWYADASGALNLTATGATLNFLNGNFYLCDGGACPTTPVQGYPAFTSNGNFVAGGTVYASGFGPATCPSGMIPVPPSPQDGMQGFCVDKYEAQNSSGNEVSVQGGSPWVSITQYDARAQCIRAGKHLITEKEWQAIAHNVEAQGWNWNGGVAGTNQMSDGHSDNDPGSSLATAADSAPCSGTNNTCDVSAWSSQRRTYKLSNGQYIWDFGGNVWEWVDQINRDNYPVNNSITANWYACATTGDGICGNTRTSNDYWYSGATTDARGFFRGGAWGDGGFSGAFALNLNTAPSYTYTALGFRCAR